MYISQTISSLSTLLLLLLPLPLTLAQNWTATDGSNISAAPGTFVLVLMSAKDSPTNTPSLSLWTETTPTVTNMPITMCSSSSSDPWQAFTAPDLPYPIGLHNSAKWCGGSNSDGLWLSYYDRFQMDVSTAKGVCGHFYTTSKLSWVCYLEANPDGRKYGC